MVTADDNRWHRCDLKTISLLGNVLMRQLATDAGAVETVMFRDGFLTEASASNVLIVKDGMIVVPPKDNLILPGITYDATMEFARDAGMPLEVRPVPKAEALAADEMWLSSSTKEVLAITTVDGKPFAGGKPGPVFRKLWAVFQAKKPHARGWRPSLRANRPTASAERSRRTGRGGTRGRRRRARSQVTTSPTNTTWSPARCRAWWRHSNHATQPVDQRRVGPAHPEVQRPRTGRRAAARSGARGRSARADSTLTA